MPTLKNHSHGKWSVQFPLSLVVKNLNGLLQEITVFLDAIYCMYVISVVAQLYAQSNLIIILKHGTTKTSYFEKTNYLSEFVKLQYCSFQNKVKLKYYLGM